MVRLRRQTEGLASEQEHGTLALLRVIFNVVIFSVSIAGLVGIVVFSCVHWTNFS